MLWEIEILPKTLDPERERALAELRHFFPEAPNSTIGGTSRGYLLEGDLSREDAERLANELLVDQIVETGRLGSLNEFRKSLDGDLSAVATVLLKPGVMDPVAASVERAASDLSMPIETVRTFRRYYAESPPADDVRACLFKRVLANEAIEQVVPGSLSMDHLSFGSEYRLERIVVAIRSLDDAGLVKLSRDGQLSLTIDEMRTIQAHYRTLDRDPTDVELETIAQTWSEHCSHKTLKGKIDFEWTDESGQTHRRQYANMLKETIFEATQKLRREWGANDWCVSVFEDNAGVVTFDDRFNVCFKVETHNHPSAIEPYGGANTGIGGVIRDPLGTGLGAKPFANTDVFCFAPPDTPASSLPAGVLHPHKVMQGVVAGVRDYGNRMGIPTVNGAVCFDPRYLGNPLVYCGTAGLIPVDKCKKKAEPGDLIVAVGGRTGRDGIHGATFSSIELTSESETVSGGAVQIGNAITEKKVLDVIIQARDLGLYHAITDCGAGGFSSAVGEMGETLGAAVQLEKAPLKYQGLSYAEIWISEAQERMILAVPPDKWPELQRLCASEDVEAVEIGTFEATGKLRLSYRGTSVGELDMHFLHDGRPPVIRKATWSPCQPASTSNSPASLSANEILTRILASWNVCSKEWIIRQYDHEVQAGSVIKPLVGVKDDGPGDASVAMPVLGSYRGVALGCGINPRLGDIDPYWMAANAIDEAVRNVVAVGADPARVAVLDNFCWGNTNRPETLGSLVRAAEACHDVALAFRMPFISGKDSLNNEFKTDSGTIVIPPTLLISAMGQVPDVRQCVTMDLKAPGNVLLLVGETRDELAGSHYHLVTSQAGGKVPKVDLAKAPAVFSGMHQAISKGLVRSCHDLSEGGLAVALAEMAFAGGVGADVTHLPGVLSETITLFSESPTRFLLEISPGNEEAVRSCFPPEIPVSNLGKTVKETRLRVASRSGEWLVWANLADLKKAWQAPLAW